MTDDGLPRAYQEALRQRGLSPATLGIVDRWLSDFLRFCEQQGLSRLWELSREHLADYRQRLLWTPGPRGRLYTPNTQDQALRSVRGFLRWAASAGHLDSDPTRELVLGRPPRPVRCRLSSVQREGLLALPELTRPAGLRDRVMLELLCDHRLEKRVCARLDTADVELERGLLVARPGRGGVRLVELADDLAGRLERYLAWARPELCPKPEERALFLNGRGGRLSDLRLGQIVRGYSRSLGLPPSLSLP